MFDRKIILKSLIIILLLIVIVFAAIQIRNTLARYESATSAERDVDVAFWIVGNSNVTKRLIIEDIYPSATPYEYTFTVSNFEDTKKAETDMEYELIITTTTNLPLQYAIKKNNNDDDCEITEELYTDGDGTYYRKIELDKTSEEFKFEQGTDTTDTYVLKVTFPESYKTNFEYSSMIEDIKIELSAKQIIEE